MKSIYFLVFFSVIVGVLSSEIEEEQFEPEAKQTSVYSVTRPVAQAPTYVRNSDGTCSKVTLLGYNAYNQPVYRVDNMNTGGSTLVVNPGGYPTYTSIITQGYNYPAYAFTCPINGGVVATTTTVRPITLIPVPAPGVTTVAPTPQPPIPAPAPPVYSTGPVTCTVVDQNNLFTVTTPVANQPTNTVTNQDGTTAQRQLIGYNCLGQPVYRDTNANGTQTLVTTDGNGNQAYQNSTGTFFYNAAPAPAPAPPIIGSPLPPNIGSGAPPVGSSPPVLREIIF